MLKFRLMLVSVILLTGPPASAQFVDTTWKITGAIGEGWFTEPTDFIGKSQTFRKGLAVGAFLNCEFQGLSKTYHTYTVEDFLANREFDLFSRNREELAITGDKVFVHRMTCGESRAVLYPFVTTEPGDQAFILFEGMVLRLSSD